MAHPDRNEWQLISQRDLFVIEATHPSEVGPEFSFPSRYFACLLAWDAVSASQEQVTELAEKLLQAGCFYICCWGPGCERVHDVFDAVTIEQQPDGPVVMSTWHADQLLSEAVRFLLFSTQPDEAYVDECRSAVGIALGGPAWAAEMREAFSDPDGFRTRRLDSDF